MIHEALLVEIVAQGAHDLVAQTQALLHRGAPQVDVTELQATLLVHLLLVQHERRGLGAVQYLHLQGQHFYLAAGEVRVLSALGAVAHFTLDAHYVFAA